MEKIFRNLRCTFAIKIDKRYRIFEVIQSTSISVDHTLVCFVFPEITLLFSVTFYWDTT